MVDILTAMALPTASLHMEHVFKFANSPLGGAMSADTLSAHVHTLDAAFSHSTHKHFLTS